LQRAERGKARRLGGEIPVTSMGDVEKSEGAKRGKKGRAGLRKLLQVIISIRGEKKPDRKARGKGA